MQALGQQSLPSRQQPYLVFAGYDFSNNSVTNASAVPESDAPAQRDAMDVETAPDLADAPISEITERFFMAIVATVPVERIEELHLFAPLRHGGVETGIAVIAARAIVQAIAYNAAEETVTLETIELPLEALAPAPGDTEAFLDGATDVDFPTTPDISRAPGVDAGQESIASTSVDDGPYAPDVLHEIVDDAIEDTVEYVAEYSGADVGQPLLPIVRHTVYTARYRLVQKGPDRGKWEATVVDEADAPLITVEMVVRGVQRRAGEAHETMRYTGAQIAHALRFA